MRSAVGHSLIGRAVAGGLAVTIAAATLAACGDDDDDSTGGGEEILVGALYTAAKGINYQDAPQGAAAYFDQLNAAGGINGRKVRFVAENDEGDPAKAAAAARRLIADGAVAFVGGDSTVDCAVNDGLYKREGIVSLPALGSNPACFASPNQIPLQNGPVVAAALAADLAVKDLGAKRVQYVTFDAPSGQSSAKVIEGFLKSKDALAGASAFVSPGKDPTPAIVRAKRADPDAIVVLATPDVSIAIIKALADQGIGPSDIPVLTVATVYDKAVPGVLGNAGEGLYVLYDWKPIEQADESPDIKKFVDAMNEHRPDARQNGLSQSAWMAADLFTSALQTLDGDVTPEAAIQAVKGVEGFENGMTVGPITVGEKDGYIINTSDLVLRIRDGKYVVDEELGVRRFPPEGFRPPQ